MPSPSTLTTQRQPLAVVDGTPPTSISLSTNTDDEINVNPLAVVDDDAVNSTSLSINPDDSLNPLAVVGDDAVTVNTRQPHLAVVTDHTTSTSRRR